MLEAISPADAVEQYLNYRRTEISDSSLQSQEYRLTRFLEWCEKTNLQNMNDVTGRRIHEFTQWRSMNVNNMTLRTQLSTIRVFLRFCEQINAVNDGVSHRVLLPKVSRHEQTRKDDLLSEPTADRILEYLTKFEYATLRHALFALIWHTGFRMGTARGLDIEDYNPDQQYVRIRHRPETGTPLKNKQQGEREVNLNPDVCETLSNYIAMHRPDVTDENGREPLFAVRSGRAGKTVIQKHFYALTRPCHHTNECPHGRDPLECEASTQYDAASKCPTSTSPHPVRRGAITAHLNADVPKEIASDRMDVSTDVLDKHYDGRTQAKRREQRRSYLDRL
ncbi:tyrosine-type recombinase/integrase [Halococcus hamelinensis]|uniref:Phage integrase/site-specific recombinase n=1 Tax=Halococcus hamelinensis 100A6 TaxID=1132509 RepID=M0M6K9_9EURY|nr:tyrosine-type recombinase/integrase [Halococcus hamelinensis]EMA41452.1 phage integrase/site-specific recombinase [Halococcus hamelinensis 100A6]